MEPPALHGRTFVIVAAEPWGADLAGVVAERGGRVVLCGPSAAPAGTATGDDDGHVVTFSADATREDGVEALFDFALERLDRLDALVVAPAPLPAQALADLTVPAWEEALIAGLRAPFLLCQRAIQEWLGTGGGGRIVIVPPAVQDGRPAQATAAAVQEALLSLTRSVAKEYGARGISCNAVVRAVEQSAPGSLIEAILFLASAEASYVTGEIVRVGPA